MGRAFKDTSVKVGGQAGPIGKGVPMTEAAGPGGQIKTLMSKALEKQQGQTANGFGGIAAAQKGMGRPAPRSMFARMFAGNPKIQKRINDAWQAKQQRQRYGGLGGRFAQFFDQKKQQANRGMAPGSMAPGSMAPPGQPQPTPQPTAQPTPVSTS